MTLKHVINLASKLTEKLEWDYYQIAEVFEINCYIKTKIIINI